MTIGYKIDEQNGLYYLTLQIVNWTDLFTRKIYRDIVIDNLKYCQQHKGLEIYAYVIMSNHIHLLARCNTGKLSDTIRDFKSFTAKQILLALDSNQESRSAWMRVLFESAATLHGRNYKYQIWTHENHPEIIRNKKFYLQKVNYIHNNPVKAGIVSTPENYLYSSAGFYCGCNGFIEITPLTFSQFQQFE